MAQERTARFEIAVGAGDDQDIRSFLSSIRTQFKSAVADLESTTNRLQLFGQLQENLPKIKVALDRSTAAVAAFTKEIEKTTAAGGKVSEDLTKGLASAEKAAAAATKEYARQNTELAALGARLKTAGVDTSNYAAAQAKLAVELKNAGAAAAENAAKQALGIKTLKDIEPEIQKLQAAYQTLRTSGTLSATELAAAHKALITRVGETNASVTTLNTSVKSGADDFGTFFSAAQAKILATIGVVTTLAASIQSITAAGNDFRQGLGQIGSVSNLTEAQLTKLGDGARELARTLGVDLTVALKALFDIVKSTGLGPDDSLSVLTESAKAAKASFTDLGVVAKVSADLISGYGISVRDLSGVLDVLFRGMNSGGPSFTDLASGIGGLSVVAKSAGVSVQELSALLNVMASASGDGAGAVTELQRLLVAFNTEGVRQRLRELGIAATDFVGVIKELSARGLGIDRLVELGVASSKAAVGVTALTRDSGALTTALETAAKAAGAVAEGVERVEKLPKDSIEKLAAAIRDTKVTIAEKTDSSGFVAALTSIFNRANDAARSLTDTEARAALVRAEFRFLTGTTPDLALALRSATEAFGEVGASTTAAKDGLALFNAEAGAANADALAELAGSVATNLADLKTKIEQVRTGLGGLATDLLVGVKALQESAAKALADAQTIADAQIAALDRSNKAAAATAAATLEIQTKLAADKLAIITANEKAITELTEKAIAAKTEALKAENKTEIQILGETAKIRLAALAPVLAAYKSHYDELVKQAQGHNANVERIEQERIAFTQNIEQAIANVRGNALDNTYATYIERTQRIDRLTSEARQAALNGDLAAAKKYADQAIQEIGRLAPAYSASGALIVTGLQTQETKLDKLTKLQGDYSSALKTQGDSAKAGADATIKEIDKVLPHLNGLKTLVDDLTRQAEKALTYKVGIEQDSIDKLLATLERLTAERTVTIKLRTVTESGQPIDVTSGFGAVGTFARGGAVRQPLTRAVAPSPLLQSIQAFAGGGNVFRPLSGAKVPGSGSGDTHPAALPVGSYVVRKSASQLYGDNIMGRLAQMFALGGSVNNVSSVIGRYFSGNAALASKLLGSNIASGDPTQIRALKVEAESLISELLGAGSGLKRSNSFQNTTDYLAAVLEIIRGSQNQPEIEQLFDSIKTRAEDFLVSFLQAKQFGVPSVMGVNISGGFDLSPGKPSKAFNALGVNEFKNLFQVARKSPYGFAGGGPVGSDMVPAWLTPGEHVISPPAVNFARRMFGGGFLDALNNMKVPKGFLDGAFNLPAPRPPLYMANGGPVPGGSTVSVSSRKERGISITANFYAQRIDAEEVRRTIAPALSKLVNRSK